MRVGTHPEDATKKGHVRFLVVAAVVAALAVVGFLGWSMGGDGDGSGSVSAPRGGERADAPPSVSRDEEPIVRPSGVEVLDAAYEACARALGFDPGFAQVLVVNGRPDLVKTGRDVPAHVHGPCLSQIGGRDTGRSSHGYPLP